MVSPRALTLTIATTAINAASIPYSMRSWPVSSATNQATIVFSCTMMRCPFEHGSGAAPRSRDLDPPKRLRRGRQRRADAREDRLHVGAGRADDEHRDER